MQGAAARARLLLQRPPPALAAALRAAGLLAEECSAAAGAGTACDGGSTGVRRPRMRAAAVRSSSACPQPWPPQRPACCLPRAAAALEQQQHRPAHSAADAGAAGSGAGPPVAQQQHAAGPPARPPPQQPLQVYACHLGAEVDLQAFCREFTPGTTSITRDHVLLEFDGLHEDKVLLGGGAGGGGPGERQIMVVYRYGSVITFNMKARDRDEWLRRLTATAPAAGRGSGGGGGGSGTAAAPAVLGGLRHDETSVVVRRDLQPWSALEPDKIVVRTLDVGNARVISHVLGQSVALDYYNSKVDEAIRTFTPYLLEVAQTGKCSDLREGRLLQLIAENSLLYTDVVTKIGLLDISQTAWTQDKYHELWQSLRVDYELERRFDAINRKLGPMLENAKFLLDIRAEKKSAEAEWIIIALICLEVVVNTYGHFVL
ncbi:hypothetical protein HT031_006265 [Scenedesmus sp. PABB004]|nr:hypothetical protein HT031_006265 [Scenedesmus sp. PABB004]